MLEGICKLKDPNKNHIEELEIQAVILIYAENFHEETIR